MATTSRPFDFDELSNSWQKLMGFSEKGRGHEVDLESYRTLLLKAFLPFQIAFQVFTEEYELVPLGHGRDNMRPFKRFESDWQIIFAPGKSTKCFYSVPVVAPMMIRPTSVSFSQNRKLLERAGVISVLIDLNVGIDSIENCFLRIKEKYRVSLDEMKQLRKRADGPSFLGLPQQKGFEPQAYDLALVAQHSQWCPYEEISKYIQTKQKISIGKSNLSSRLREQLIPFLDTRGLSDDWCKLRKKRGAPGTGARAEKRRKDLAMLATQTFEQEMKKRYCESQTPSSEDLDFLIK